MKKIFLSYSDIRNNAIKLAHRIYLDGFTPDIIYVSLRGGAYIGNVISEYFKLIQKGRRPVFYAAVVARSYQDINSRTKVRVDGWTYNPEYIRQGDKILLLDDIFDSGHTINYLVGILLEKGVPKEDIKVAVHDYKERIYIKEKLPIKPDYYCKHHVIKSPEQDFWIHYLSHELEGLGPRDRDVYYNIKDDPELRDAFDFIITP